MATLQELVRTWSNENYYDVEQIQTTKKRLYNYIRL